MDEFIRALYLAYRYYRFGRWMTGARTRRLRAARAHLIATYVPPTASWSAPPDWTHDQNRAGWVTGKGTFVAYEALLSKQEQVNARLIP